MSKVPMNLIFPDRTAAGISRNEQGQRVIASTRRPDGTRIRPGFTPQEDVALFRSQKQLDLDRHRAQKGTVPGLNPLFKNALDGMQQSKSAKKNQKRKENKAAANNNNNPSSPPPPKDSWDDDDDDTETVQGADKSGTTPTTAPETTTTTTTEDPTKRLRNLRKKLKQTEQLVAKQQDVAPTLSQAEQDKVDNLESLRKEIESLELNL
ncbi:hypothetical protein JCM3766R1_000610 [Sporobolomyces carnicolor]